LDQEAVGSYDSNDILVLEGDEIYLDQADGYLHYIIRFQNTGNYYAERVRITNELDDKFDWETLSLESYSHNSVKITNGNHLEFQFDAIYLPASETEEQASQGYVAYKIKPNPGAEIGDVFLNQASIYFDYNPAIETNIASTEIVEEIMHTRDFSNSKIVIYPNPTNGTLFIRSESDVKQTHFMI